MNGHLRFPTRCGPFLGNFFAALGAQYFGASFAATLS
jgi:hypothetical protein